MKMPQGLHVGVVGPLEARAPGAIVERGRLGDLAGDRLVLVSAASSAVGRSGGCRRRASGDALRARRRVGGGQQGSPNLAGIVLRHDQAARLGGVVAGLIVADEGARQPRVAWVGPRSGRSQTPRRGRPHIAPAAIVLRQWSADRPAACKESALEVIPRGATVVRHAVGLCAEAAIAGAHQQNAPGYASRISSPRTSPPPRSSGTR